MAQGHMIPAIDMAKLFAAHGVKATFVTTPLTMPVVSKTIEKTNARSINIDIKIIKFLAVEAGLPEGCENIDTLISSKMIPTFVLATSMLRQPLEDLIQEYQPSCLVADMLFPWAVDVAVNLVFLGLFSMVPVFSQRLQDFVSDNMNLTRKFHLILKYLSFLTFQGR